MLLEKSDLINLYEEHSAALYRYAYRLLGDQEVSEDCVSDIFMKFLQVIKKDNHIEGNIKAYLYRMVHNWAVDYYRKQNHDLDISTRVIEDPEIDPEQDVFLKQRVDKVRMALIKMAEDQRMVIELRFMENWTHEKVAAFLGKTVEATRTLQHRALVALHKSIDSTWM